MVFLVIVFDNKVLLVFGGLINNKFLGIFVLILVKYFGVFKKFIILVNFVFVFFILVILVKVIFFDFFFI